MATISKKISQLPVQKFTCGYTSVWENDFVMFSISTSGQKCHVEIEMAVGTLYNNNNFMNLLLKIVPSNNSQG